MITSGLLGELADRGIDRIAEITLTNRKALVRQFQTAGFGPLVEIDEPILIPQIQYLTNDSWELVSALSGPNGWPLLHDADYGSGHLYVLTIPDNFADLYRLPEAVLNSLREVIAQDLFVRLNAPANVALMPYDNDTFIVESFNDEPVTIEALLETDYSELIDLESGETLSAQAPAAGRGRGFFGTGAGTAMRRFNLQLEPHSFRVLRAR